MSKYKVGDKVVMEIGKYEGFYGISDNLNPSLIHWHGDDDLDRYAEPLSTYTEPLEAKIRRQAVEITRLLRENNELKQQMKFDLPTLISEEDIRRMDINKARAEGAEVAWELARKCMLMTDRERKTIFGSGHNALYGVLTYFDYKHAAAKVVEWEKAKAKPQKTMMQDFLEKFPKAELNSQGTPYGICPSYLGYKTPKCNFGCVECWNRPLEQIGEEK